MALDTPTIYLVELLDAPEIYLETVSDNTLESYTTTSPFDKLEECAKFTIGDIQDAFVLEDVTAIGKEYTLSFWLKANVEGYVRTTGGGTFKAGSSWQKCVSTFTAEETDLAISFDTAGTYYLYNVQIELGNKASDWAPNPDDIEYRIRQAELKITDEAIIQAVSEVYQTKEGMNGYYTKSEAETLVSTSAKGVLTTVEETYQTIDAMSDYPTTTQMDLKIEETAAGVKQEVSAKYTTNEDFNKLAIGSRNLLLNTNFTATEGEEAEAVKVSGSDQATSGITSWANSAGVLTLNGNGTGSELYYRFMVPAADNLYTLRAGQEYTISGKAKIKTTSGTLTSLNVRSQHNISGWTGGLNEIITNTDTESTSDTLKAPHIFLTNDANAFISVDPEGWVEFAFTHEIPEEATGAYFSIQVYYDGSWAGTVELAELKLERGNRATDWTPAPEDFASAESMRTANSLIEQAADNILLCVKEADVDGDYVIGKINLDSTTALIQAKHINLKGSVTIEALADDTVKRLDDIEGKIPDDVSDLTGSEGILYAEDVLVSAETTTGGITKETVAIGEKEFTVIKNGDFVLLGQPYGKESEDQSTSYTYIDADGLLTAHNAIIYGTIYATDGEFTGTVHATAGEFAGKVEASSGFFGNLKIVSGRLQMTVDDTDWGTKHDVWLYTEARDHDAPGGYIQPTLRLIDYFYGTETQGITDFGMNSSGETVVYNVTHGGYIIIGESVKVNALNVSEEITENGTLLSEKYAALSHTHEHTHNNITNGDGTGKVALLLDGDYYYMRPHEASKVVNGSVSYPWYNLWTERLNVTVGRPVFTAIGADTGTFDPVTYATNMYVGTTGIVSRSTNTSSRTIKHDITDLTNKELRAENLYNLPVHQAKYNADVVSKEDGRYLKDLPMFIIEEMEEVYPIAIDKPSEDVKTWSWNPQYLIPPILKLVQLQHNEILAIWEEIKLLKSA